MRVVRSRIAGGPGAARMSLTALLPGLTPGVGQPPAEDLSIQLRHASDGAWICIRIPAARLRPAGRKLRFRDQAPRLESARGIDELRLAPTPNGPKLRLQGKRAQLGSVDAGDVHVTIGLRNPTVGDAANRCAATAVTYERARRGLRLR